MTGRARTIATELAWFALFVLMAVIITWPLARHVTRAVSDMGDPLLNTWIVDWDCYALSHSPLHLYDAPVFAPAKLPLAYSENLVGIAIFALPFHLAGASPLTVYNLMMLLGFAMSGYGAFVLARMITRSPAAAFLAGVFYAFNEFKIDHVAHLQIIWSGWLPLMLAALLWYWRRPSWKTAALFAGAFAMNGLTNVHWLLFGSFSIAATIAFLAAAGERRDLRFWLRLGVALVAGGLVLLPFLQPYRVVSNTYGMHRDIGEVEGGSANWTDWLMTTERNVIHGKNVTDQKRGHPERELFPGLFVLLLSLTAVVMTRRESVAPLHLDDADQRRRTRWLLRTLDLLILLCLVGCYLGMAAARWRWAVANHTIIALDSADVPFITGLIAVILRLSIAIPQGLGGGTLRSRIARSRFPIDAWAAALWIAIGFAGSFGTNFLFHMFLYRRVQIFQSIRVPARWAIITYTGLAVWAALGIVALLANRRDRVRRGAVVAALFAALLLDVWPSIRWELGPPEPSEFYRWLNATRGAGGSVLELPIDSWGSPYLYMLGATVHHVPIMNGTSGFEPPLHNQLRMAARDRKYDDAFLAALERNGCALVVLHVDLLGGDLPVVTKWLEPHLATGRIAFVRRFDNEVFGDYVFAITKNARDWQRLAAPNDRETLARLLRIEPTYNHTTFGRMDQPKVDQTVFRQLEITGWVLSPHGIRSVEALIDGGRLRVPAVLTPREDITRTWPWYPQTPSPAFTAVIPKRPKNIPRDTDVQVLVTDGSGRVTRLQYVPFAWH